MADWWLLLGGARFRSWVVLSKHGGIISQELHGGVRFVPLIGEHGWEGGRES